MTSYRLPSWPTLEVNLFAPRQIKRDARDALYEAIRARRIDFGPLVPKVLIEPDVPIEPECLTDLGLDLREMEPPSLGPFWSSCLVDAGRAYQAQCEARGHVLVFVAEPPTPMSSSYDDTLAAHHLASVVTLECRSNPTLNLLFRPTEWPDDICLANNVEQRPFFELTLRPFVRDHFANSLLELEFGGDVPPRVIDDIEARVKALARRCGVSC